MPDPIELEPLAAVGHIVFGHVGGEELLLISKEVEVNDVPQGSDPIAPGDFFALDIIARVIGDWIFLDPYVQASNLSCHFGFKTEAVTFQHEPKTTSALLLSKD